MLCLYTKIEIDNIETWCVPSKAQSLFGAKGVASSRLKHIGFSPDFCSFALMVFLKKDDDCLKLLSVKIGSGSWQDTENGVFLKSITDGLF